MIKLFFSFSFLLFFQIVFGQPNRCEIINRAIEFVLNHEAAIDTEADFSKLLKSQSALVAFDGYTTIEILRPTYWKSKDTAITEQAFAEEVYRKKELFNDSICDFGVTVSNWNYSIVFSDIIFDVIVIKVNDYSLNEASGYGPSGNFVEYAIEVSSSDSFAIIYRFSGSY